MVKRKTIRKLEEKNNQQKTGKGEEQTKQSTPLAAFAIKALSVILSAILIIALTLYVLGKMPARGFFSLAVLLAVIAFFVLPWMRRKYT